jgi:hypothetical protein
MSLDSSARVSSNKVDISLSVCPGSRQETRDLTWRFLPGLGEWDLI